jgi:hypothetical protein
MKSMQNTLVRVSAESTRTRVLITQGTTDIGRAILPPCSGAHPRAMSTLFEGLSLCLNERLAIVLCVDESSASCASLDLFDAVDRGERSVFYEIGVAARLSRANRPRGERSLRLGRGEFRDLRPLTLWGTR